MTHTSTAFACAFSVALDACCLAGVATGAELLGTLRNLGYSLDESMLAVRACVSAELIA